MEGGACCDGVRVGGRGGGRGGGGRGEDRSLEHIESKPKPWSEMVCPLEEKHPDVVLLGSESIQPVTVSQRMSHTIITHKWIKFANT